MDRFINYEESKDTQTKGWELVSFEYLLCARHDAKC